MTCSNFGGPIVDMHRLHVKVNNSLYVNDVIIYIISNNCKHVSSTEGYLNNSKSNKNIKMPYVYR